MTIAEMRQLLGLADDMSDAAVVEAYAASLSGQQSTDAGALPLTLDEVKRQLRIELSNTDRDTELTGLIADVTRWVEKESGHLLYARTVRQAFRSFGPLSLTAWPIAPTSLPVVTYDDGEDEQSVEGVRVITRGQTAVVVPGAGLTWPASASDGGVTVTIRAGYEAGEAIPGTLRRAMLVLASGFDEGGAAVADAERAARALCALERPVAL